MPLAPSRTLPNPAAAPAADGVGNSSAAHPAPGAANGLAAPTAPLSPPALVGGIDQTPGTAAAATTAPSLRPPASRLAAARARYAQDGQASMSKPQLLVALYQRLVRDLLGAEQAIGERDYERASNNLQHAQDIVLALEEALDPDAWAGARDLGSLYVFIYGQLVNANVTKDAGLVAQCRELVEPLAAAWQEAVVRTAATAHDSNPGEGGPFAATA